MKADPAFVNMLALLRAFVTRNNLSARTASVVIGVSFATTARWIDPEYNAFGTYARVIRRVTGIIQTLNDVDKATGLYDRVAMLPAADRAAALIAATRA